MSLDYGYYPSVLIKIVILSTNERFSLACYSQIIEFSLFESNSGFRIPHILTGRSENLGYLPPENVKKLKMAKWEMYQLRF